MKTLIGYSLDLKSKIELIIIKFIANKPLNPSTKLAPFIMNKKHNSTNNLEKILFSIHGILKNQISLYLYKLVKNLLQIKEKLSLKLISCLDLYFF